MKLKLLTLCCTAATLTACGGGSSNDMATLTLKIAGLENLGASAVYEGWLLVGGKAKSAGRFTVNASGALSTSTFSVERSDADAATAYVLTIEPAVNDAPSASDIHLLGGDFDATRSTATLGVQHPAAFGTDFAQAAGKFLLATPTNAGQGTDDQGIWFVMPVNGTPQPGLSLPALPAKGWVYEGWVVVNGVPMSTGRFTQVSGADSDGAGKTAGTGSFGPFPGQDFINPAVHLPGGMAVISIEPEPDNSPAPFLLKPLINPLIGTLTGGSNPYTLTNQAKAVNPTGTVTISR
ncbi:MAG: hypothetical protein LCH89_08605 [Proteobacteria bacterium]|nr:hypothetical protein [Pseudomonadota bacterium]